MEVTADAAPAGKAENSLLGSFTRNLQSYVLVITLLVIWIGFTIGNKNFISANNIIALLPQMALIGIMATGMVFVIVTGGIDLSVGYGSGFVSVAAAWLLYTGTADRWVNAVLPGLGGSVGSGPHAIVTAALVVVLGLALGLAMGALQGLVISRLSVPPFIVTLGGFSIFKSGILVVTGGKVLFANAYSTFKFIAQGYLPPWLGLTLAALVAIGLFVQVFSARARKRKHGAAVGSLALQLLRAGVFSALALLYVLAVNRTFEPSDLTSVRGVPMLVLILGVVALAMHHLSTGTRFGRYAYAYGGNRDAARLSGVNIKSLIFRVYLLMGLLMGVSGVTLAAYVGMGTTAAGAGAELDVISSCILGGTSTLGGEGSVFGALVGALIIQSLSSGLQIMDKPPAVQYLIKGFVLILAVYADIQFKKKRS